MWNSLEVVKLIVSAATPIFVVIVGFWLNRRLKSLEQAQWSQQKIIERRIRAYDEMATPLNQILCFFCYVGSWKEMTPPGQVHIKRSLDQTAHISAPLFDENFLVYYNSLMDVCFSTFGAWGDDAKLKTLPDRREQVSGARWERKWATCFTSRDEASEPEVVRDAYAQLMAYLARAIGAVEVDAHLLSTTEMPGNFDSRAAGVVSRIE
jgi:hypothetical protein